MKIRTLLIGLGRIGTSLENDKLRYHPCTHAGVLFSKFGRKHFELTSIIDKNEIAISNFIKQWKIKKGSINTELNEIKKETIDLAVIASSSEAHFENVKLAISLGIKNFLIEKPVCMNEIELAQLLKLEKKYKLRIWVNHERRYHFLYKYVKNLIQSKEYGDLRTIRASVLTSFRDPGNAFQKGGGPLLHDGTHAIDYIEFLLESLPISISSRLIKASKNAIIEEQAICFLTYPNDVFVFLEAGGKRKYFQFEIDIQTESARFILSNDGHKFFKASPSKLYQGFQSLNEFSLPKTPKKNSNPWINIYSEIESVLNGKTTEILGSLGANARIFNTIQAIYRGKMNSMK